ncbi:unnamed protein product [Arabidopsis lyrata]|uniref:F-box associated beta-propeller type 3 domain-containing protein n=1 Tax=Arabidopsis lyrata subsp. lyrata TaxID=81972 RepID=D7KVM2_ARALL|nr:hypothetical protein ARALYDRAFT_894512 [Arabidopsis lyrata subsp. lyrata]CAH8257388.1 unnamed protein product [Arabidopsis lyrata]
MGEKSWRPITFKDGHSLETEGLFKGGVLYYAADLYSDSTRVIMSFNVRSEDFSVLELPKDVDFSIGWNLVNSKRKLPYLFMMTTTMEFCKYGLEKWVYG